MARLCVSNVLVRCSWPSETKIAPPKRPRERQREEDEAAKQPRTVEPAEAAEPADEQEVDVLFAELFGDDE